MSAATPKAIDKSTWGPGPWQAEPDRLEFEHAGFPCIIQRVNSGALCGYVAVPLGHPWHGVAAWDLSRNPYPDGRPQPDPEAHGGITYASKCAGNICHLPKHGESDDVWWLGFDHNHAYDLAPAGNEWRAQNGFGHHGRDEIYRTIDYARTGCESLAEQAKAVAK